MTPPALWHPISGSDPRPTPRSSTTRQRTRAFLVFATAGAMLSACSGSSGPISFASFGHVHAIEMDVQSGVLYVASHNGVWKVAIPESVEGFPSHDPVKSGRIADRAQDTMGFTITADGAMFASGHPDPRERPELDPAHLGLIRSVDGAETWESVSLQEKADFHALEAVGLENSDYRIYGSDSTAGILRISDDSGESWQNGGEVEIIDLAADLAHPDVLYVTTPSGLLRSVDAGRSFTPFHAVSTLALIEPLSSGLVGVDSTGSVWRTMGDSLSKTGGGVNGQFEAFGAFENGNDVWLLVSDEDGISASRDWGQSWTAVVPR